MTRPQRTLATAALIATLLTGPLAACSSAAPPATSAPSTVAPAAPSTAAASTAPSDPKAAAACAAAATAASKGTHIDPAELMTIGLQAADSTNWDVHFAGQMLHDRAELAKAAQRQSDGPKYQADAVRALADLRKACAKAGF